MFCGRSLFTELTVPGSATGFPEQQLRRARSGHQLSCCLVSLHFLWDIVSTGPVHLPRWRREPLYHQHQHQADGCTDTLKSKIVFQRLHEIAVHDLPNLLRVTMHFKVNVSLYLPSCLSVRPSTSLRIGIAVQ